MRARARVYVFMCARVPAYFGILIARGRPSPLSFPLRSSASSRSSPHLVPYRAPAPRPHPQGYPSPSLSSPRVPLETLPIPKTFETLYATSSHTYFHVHQPASLATAYTWRDVNVYFSSFFFFSFFCRLAELVFTPLSSRTAPRYCN